MPTSSGGPLPGVPDAEQVGTFLNAVSPQNALPDVTSFLPGNYDPNTAAAVGSGLVPAALVGGYITEGDRVYSDLGAYIREQSQRGSGGKLRKPEAVYVPASPLPYGLWEYKCETCRFYQEDGETAEGVGRCTVVGQKGDPFGGETIHAGGWCTAWLPEDGTEAFDYLSGNGA